MDETRIHALMVKSLAGDAGAYRSFLASVAADLRPFVRRRLFSGPDEAEDVVQEVLTAVHLKRHTYDPTQPVTAWLYAIARYKLTDHLRRGRRRGGHAPIKAADEEAGPSDVEDGAHRRDLERLLSRLPPKQQRAIRLVKLDQLSVREAALAASMSESDIKVSVHRGLKTLARLVSEEDPT
jgi:RNA polymerase sigma-70 factor (ECF subfamily)